MKKIKLKVLILAAFSIFGGFFGVKVFAEGEEQPSINNTQKNIIIDHCDTIKDNLKSLQRVDSRTRVYLGRYYETILTKFITPLNIRLVENNISNPKLVENQTNFADKRNDFSNDFIIYQQALEELINVNCKNEPEKFYEKLEVAREKRRVVNKDIKLLRVMVDEQKKMVEELRNGI